MRGRTGWAILAAGTLGLVAVAWEISLAADAPAEPKISTYAPAADLDARVQTYLKKMGESLASKDDYDESQEKRVSADAATTAVIVVALGRHDQDSALKQAAPAVLEAVQALNGADKTYEGRLKTLPNVIAKIAGGKASQELPAWGKVADLSDLMRQVPIVQAELKSGVSDERRFKRQSAQAASAAAVLAVIAEETLHDDSHVGDAKEKEAWQKYSIEWRDAAGEANSAVHAGDQPRAAAALEKMVKSCEACHAAFRPEEKK